MKDPMPTVHLSVSNFLRFILRWNIEHEKDTPSWGNWGQWRVWRRTPSGCSVATDADSRFETVQSTASTDSRPSATKNRTKHRRKGYLVCVNKYCKMWSSTLYGSSCVSAEKASRPMLVLTMSDISGSSIWVKYLREWLNRQRQR